ncbi:MAG: hypothetical protein WBV74_19700 [Pseudonocardiaceae bacterium]
MEFEMLKPGRRDGVDAMESTEDVAGDGAGGVTVSGVVDREPETVDEVVGGECGAHGDGKRFLTDPGSAEVFGDLFWGESALAPPRMAARADRQVWPGARRECRPGVATSQPG